MPLVANSLSAPSICGAQFQRQACSPSTSSASTVACSSRHKISSRTVPSITSQPRRRRAGLAICEIAVGRQGAAAAAAAAAGVGSRIRVKGPLKVFHVPKNPEFDLGGQEGEVKEVLTSWKGKIISANLPYKTQFALSIDGKEVKLIAHLREDEFEVIG
ncbi:ferredoxin-thioredoxin reductase, variable chain [Selaginella moellendorffii]|uniref:ferredoxin-thioredoxin reductase, variable chain n=1 Tax=Selaginella moellendorffii TaxID=88036 RepID=UPI000D1C312A|nr:ferredoxin-thioredoxin reductase, variable chain [Selaginella moellendorffii]|eukprot:XP_002960561.2 ferredoxin-thioredoxin reductase, variable chain [Selaginella moellendorffii]